MWNRYVIRNLLSVVSILLLLNSIGTNLRAQDSLSFTESISVLGRPFGKSIQLRWAPGTSYIWLAGNRYGYVIEKFTLSRDGKLLNTPEKIELTPVPLKPLPQEDWSFNVPRNRYYAIAAQALFGERFEVDVAKSDVFSIVNKVYEKEQRFAFALFAADMSAAVAMASGLSFTDTKVRNGEKYLYRISVSTSPQFRGSIFIGSDDEYMLPKPQNLTADRTGSAVSLRWRKSASGKYCAYNIERSSDGKIFIPNSDIPFIPLEQNPSDGSSLYEYASDSVSSVSETYYYRVVGLTPFGESGLPSDVVEVKPSPNTPNAPHITSAVNHDNKSIQLSWEFDKKDIEKIKGFHVERSSKPSGPFSSLTLKSPLPPTTRSYLDISPNTVNYYRVSASTSTGSVSISPTYLVQMVDSIPPSVPTGLSGEVDEEGTIRISWQQNTDADIFGYRVYRANNAKEEPAQITDEPITATSLTDRVSLNTLNDGIDYRVMAIDKNQNHSSLSQALRILLPDKVKPQPVVFLPPQNGHDEIIISWKPSPSIDVVKYELFEKVAQKNEWRRLTLINVTGDIEWRRLTLINVTGDSIYSRNVNPSKENEPTTYTVVAVDRSGLESEPAIPVIVTPFRPKLYKAINWKMVEVEKQMRRVLLQWDAPQDEAITSIKIFRAVDDDVYVSYKTLSGDTNELVDPIEPGRIYRYRLIATFETGTKSELSSVATAQY